jgi:hypothetical protein
VTQGLRRLGAITSGAGGPASIGQFVANWYKPDSVIAAAALAGSRISAVARTSTVTSSVNLPSAVERQETAAVPRTVLRLKCALVPPDVTAGATT